MRAWPATACSNSPLFARAPELGLTSGPLNGAQVDVQALAQQVEEKKEREREDRERTKWVPWHGRHAWHAAGQGAWGAAPGPGAVPACPQHLLHQAHARMRPRHVRTRARRRTPRPSARRAFAQLANYWADQLTIQQQQADQMRKTIAKNIRDFHLTDQVRAAARHARRVQRMHARLLPRVARTRARHQGRTHTRAHARRRSRARAASGTSTGPMPRPLTCRRGWAMTTRAWAPRPCSTLMARTCRCVAA